MHRLSLLALSIAAALAGWPVTGIADDRLEFFEKRIRPLLAENCHNCHSANTNSQGGLRADDRQGLIGGGGRGPAIVPGDPENSLLIVAVSQTSDELKMPPENRLTDEQVADLKQWIKDGAAWPEEALPDDVGALGDVYAHLRQNHWAWQPLSPPAPPSVNDAAWTGDDIDRFIFASLESTGLHAVAEADKVALIRRLTFDLTGLPPTVAEIDAFVADSTEGALASVVDRLLASPAFGERWGRHWLDVARYGESTGSARNLPYPHAWRYRDYVIDSLNSDKPYNQFVREQIAGDLLPANSPQEKAEQLVATGFLALGVKDVNQRFQVRYVMDNIDEQIDAVSRAILGLTVSCARCHDHKFDPVPTHDYYALAGIFRSTETCDALRNKMGGGGLDYYVPVRLILLADQGEADAETKAKIEAAREAVKAAQRELATMRDSPKQGNDGGERQKKLMAARQALRQKQVDLAALNDPAVLGPVAMGVRESSAIGDTEIRIRGEAEKLGPIVPRGFLSAFTVPGAAPINPEQSGRLELARWLTSPQNALALRVAVNRIWGHLFGQGLVRSVDNFGVTGDSPSHPELLDHLANRFVEQGWSVKKLVRAIVLTRAYRLSSTSNEKNAAIDPSNRLVWRHSPRRLDAEEIRDAMLAVSGLLDLKRPAAPAKDFKVIELPNNGPLARGLEQAAATSPHRSVYLPLLRGLTPTSLSVFDFAEQGMVTGDRDTTTVAPQALYMLNDPFVRRQSLAMAERLLNQPDLTDPLRIEAAYRNLLGRSPSEEETERALGYLADYQAEIETVNAAAPPSSAAESDRNNVESEAAVPSSARADAWASFCQALMGTVEFRYVK